MALPFVCPLDYVFNPGDFEDSGRQHGPSVGIRDHSFFRHPNLPQRLKVRSPLQAHFVGNMAATVRDRPRP